MKTRNRKLTAAQTRQAMQYAREYWQNEGKSLKQAICEHGEWEDARVFADGEVAVRRDIHGSPRLLTDSERRSLALWMMDRQMI